MGVTHSLNVSERFQVRTKGASYEKVPSDNRVRGFH